MIRTRLVLGAVLAACTISTFAASPTDVINPPESLTCNTALSQGPQQCVDNKGQALKYFQPQLQYSGSLPKFTGNFHFVRAEYLQNEGFLGYTYQSDDHPNVLVQLNNGTIALQLAAAINAPQSQWTQRGEGEYLCSASPDACPFTNAPFFNINNK